MLPWNKPPAPSVQSVTPFFLDILSPVIVLVAHTLLVFVLLYAYRIPEMIKKKVNVKKLTPAGPEALKEWSKMDPRKEYPAQNYNHLCEQPTLFYATIFFIQLFRNGVFKDDVVLIGSAWTYVGFRLVHSIEQCFRNDVSTRFYLFAVSSLSLFVMVGKVLLSVLLA